MPPTTRRRLPLVIVALTTLTMLLIPHFATAQSLEQARAERARIQQRLDDAADELADVEARIGTFEDEAAALAKEMEALREQARRAQDRIAARVRDLYKRGIDAPVLQLFAGVSADEALDRAELVRHLLSDDQVAVETAIATHTRMTEVEEQLTAKRAELDAALAEQQSVLAELGKDLERAKELEERLEAEERRRQEEARRRAEAEKQRAAAEARARSAGVLPSSGGYACPVTQPRSFTDTWGAARSGGRSHQGTDILNPYGNEVVAITSGVWDVRTPGRLAGNWGMLRGSDGHTYYYMHLQQHVVGDGARVTAGQVVALNGDTGNATGTPHVHFEYHPGGGGAVNPYPLLKGLCG